MSAKRNSKRHSIKVATYNLGNASDDRVYKDLQHLESLGVKIMGLEEHGDRGKMTDRFVRENPQWGKFSGDGRPGGEKTCVLYSKSVGDVKAKVSKTLVGSRKLPSGAGPENAGPKVSNRVRFSVGRKRLNFVVGHQYATVGNRREAAHLFLTSLSQLILHRVGVTVLVGDFNQDAKASMHVALRKLLPSWSRTAGTHGRRVIDIIWARGARVLNSITVTGSSDHKAAVADIVF